MRKHFIFAVKEGDKIPAGGSPRTWLEYYKMNPENEEVFLPFTKEGILARRGDVLWIMCDRVLLAWVPILRVMEDAMNNGRPEIWYDAKTLCRTSRPEPLEGPEYTTGIVDPVVGESWFATK